MKIYNKIKQEGKFVYGLIAGAVFILALMSIFLYRDILKHQDNLLIVMMKPLLEMKQKEAQSFFTKHSNVVVSIVQSEEFKTFVKTEEEKESLQKLFTSISLANPSIVKIKYIDESGDEIIKIEKDYGAKAIKDVKKELDLSNRATLKVTQPAWIDGKARGNIAIDIDLGSLLFLLGTSNIFNLFLIDQDGYCLIDKHNILNDFKLTKSELKEIEEFQPIGDLFFIKFFNSSNKKLYAVAQLSDDFKALTDKDIVFLIGQKLTLLLLWILLIGYFISRMMQKIYSELTRKIEEKERAEDKLIHKNTLLLKQQDYFMKKMMHEVGTPVSIIILNVDLLSKKYGESKHLNMIKASSKVLTTIYDDIAYTISKKSNTYEAQMIDLCEFVHNRVSYFYESLKVKSIVCEVECSESSMILINKIELQRLLDNTISNAIKYSHEHAKIVIQIKTKDDTISLYVEDFGIGIKNIENIFTNFYRDESEHVGLGIGLSIVNDICKSNDIKIEVSSVLDKGTIFTYTFNRPLDLLKDSGDDI